jgi:glycine dehydrogenase subunit 1
MDIEIAGDADPTTSVTDLVAQVDDNTACVIVQSPNFLGQVETLAGLADAIHEKEAKTLLVVATNPISLGLLKPPGAYDADIVLGEGQPLGLGLNFGGPYLGFYATKQAYVRQMAGRLVGKTVDADGATGYVMTLTTREQHIRRDKATSNICSNQGLMALAATVYLSTLGKQGLRRVAELNYHKAHYAAAQIEALDGYTVNTAKPFFNEFVVTCPAPVADINSRLLNDHGILGGYDLGRDYGGWDHQMLVAVTEMAARAEIDAFVAALADAAEGGAR